MTDVFFGRTTGVELW